MEETRPHIVVQDLTVAHGSNVILHDFTLTINRGGIFIHGEKETLRKKRGGNQWMEVKDNE